MRKAIIYLILVIMLISSVEALGIAPAKTTMEFSPRVSKQGAIRIIVDDIPSKVLLTAEGELSKYIKLENTNLLLEEKETWINFNVDFPEELPPGERIGSIMVLQVPTIDNTDVVMAAPAVMHQIKVNVPYPGKYAVGKMYITNTELNKPILFTIALANFGKEDVKNAKATIVIKGPTNEQIGIIHTDTVSIGTGQENKLLATWETPNAGSYVAECTVQYDGKLINLNENFNVGNLEIEIERIEINDFKLGQIAKIDVSLMNKWNSPVKVEGRVEIFKENQIVSTFNSVPVEVLPGSTEIMNAYWNTQDISVGDYDISVKAQYNGKISEKSFTSYVSSDKISVKDATGQVIRKQGSQNTIVLSLLVLVLIIANVFLFLYINKRLKKPPLSGQ